MSHFSSALEQALTDLQILKQDFAKTIGVGRGVVSSYTGALIPIGARTVARVCAALPMPQRGRVLKGYLLDQVPEGSENVVRIDVQSTEPHQPHRLPEMDDELATAIAYLASRALDENIFRSLVIDLYQLTSKESTKAPGNQEIASPAQTTQPIYRDFPLVGMVPAGPLSDNPQQPESYVQVPAGKYPEDAFGLRVQGDSMIGKKIFDGDIVVVHKREAKPGDVVVALIDGETTLKTLVSVNGKYKLRSENPKHKNPILTDQSAIQAVMIDKL